jgi:hypothetical protein
MSLLIRAALLGGLAYVVSRAVRTSQQQSLEFPRSQPQRLSRNTDEDQSEMQSTQQQEPSTSST